MSSTSVSNKFDLVRRVDPKAQSMNIFDSGSKILENIVVGKSRKNIAARIA